MSTSKTVYFFTQAYNAEKTLSRTIESVLAQSYTNIIFYIADSASTDNTREIILHYANIDNRVKPILLSKNCSWEMYHIIPEILKSDCEGYFAQIDADDEYDPFFAEKLLAFMRINNLEIASCTSTYINGITGEDISKSTMKEDLFIEENDFQELFPEYFRYFRDSWGKIFSLQILKNIDYTCFDNGIMTGSVTYLPFTALLHANRVGVYHERLHKYYLYPDSFERNKKNLGRILTPTLYLFYYEYVIKKCGSITDANKEFLFHSYCNAISSKIKNLDLNSLSLEEHKRLSSLIKDNKLWNLVIENGNATYISILNNLISLINGEK